MGQVINLFDRPAVAHAEPAKTKGPQKLPDLEAVRSLSRTLLAQRVEAYQWRRFKKHLVLMSCFWAGVWVVWYITSDSVSAFGAAVIASFLWAVLRYMDQGFSPPIHDMNQFRSEAMREAAADLLLPQMIDEELDELKLNLPIDDPPNLA